MVVLGPQWVFCAPSWELPRSPTARFAVVDLVVGLLFVGEFGVGGLLHCDGAGVGFHLHSPDRPGPAGPQQPAVRGGDDLDVATVVAVFARPTTGPPSVGPGVRQRPWIGQSESRWTAPVRPR
jgi:hypothetical protein